MSIDPQRLLARAFAPVEHSYGARDTQLYALALGLGADPLDESALPYVYEGACGDELRALPTFANVLAYPGFWAREPDTGIDWKRLLHAEQQLVLHGPLPAAARVIGQTRVSALWDRGAAKGAFMEQERLVREVGSGRPLATVRQLTLLRGDGGLVERDQHGSDGAPPTAHRMPERAPDAVCDLATAGAPHRACAAWRLVAHRVVAPARRRRQRNDLAARHCHRTRRGGAEPRPDRPAARLLKALSGPAS